MYCILVTGIPASGKSTLANYLSQQLQIPVISKDAIKELLFDGIGFHSREEKKQLGVVSMQLMYQVAGQMMKCHQPIILENNFENSSKEGMEAILKEYGYTAITITLTGDFQTIYERFVQRNASPDRHSGHVVNDYYPRKAVPEDYKAMSYDQYVKAITQRGMDTFYVNGPKMKVDVTDFTTFHKEQLLNQVKNIIGEPKEKDIS